MSFDSVLAFVLEREGGFADDPDDPGGRTNFGVTQMTYDAYRTEDLNSVTMDVEDISEVEVQDIYRQRYWEAAQCGLIPHPLNLVHMDCAVNQGVKVARENLQKAVGTTPDGVFGPQTLEAIARTIERGQVYDATNTYLWLRLAQYRHLAQRRGSLLKFLPGWIRRLEHVQDVAHR